MQDKQPARPHVGAFAPGVGFLPALARLWLAQGGGHDGLIILPSRRAVQALAGAFLQANDEKALLLPRIIALGNVDEAGLMLAKGVALPPAMDAMRRQALLTRLILQKPQENGAPQRLPASWRLAAEFATLLDEADHAEIDLAETLPRLVPGEFSEHWQKTLAFLDIVTHAWPKLLAAEGVMNPARRLALLIDAQAKMWRDSPPSGKVWMVASEGTPAIARMAKIISELPEGRLILPGFDPYLEDSAWQALPDSHAQAGIARLLAEIDVRRAEVEQLPAMIDNVPAGRDSLMSRTLLPASSLVAWQHQTSLNLAGLSRLETGDEAQNAMAIAMLLRDALQTPGRSAALVTPDRALAVRVAATLRRFGVMADDSAGEALANTPPAVFMRLLAQAACEGYAPLPLLALLKHPMATGGTTPQAFRDSARRLEIMLLRGPRPPVGLAGLRSKLENLAPGEGDRPERVFLVHLESLLAPLALSEIIHPVVALTGLVEAAESLASTSDQSGAERLWFGEAGNALSTLLSTSIEALEDMPEMPLADLPDLLDALIGGQVVRKPRAKDGHPRIAIWGLQEAALQTVDVVVLGGLVEGVWPAPEEPGPWLSRPMRRQAGLPSPERKIGQAAHAFFSLTCVCPQVVLAAPKRRDRAPVVPARWLTRLSAMLSGQGLELPTHAAAGWAAQLDLPVTRVRRPKPYPRPPSEKRLRVYSISDVTTLMADPYAVYARKILKLSPLEPLDAENDASQFGEVVHAGLASFFSESAVTSSDALVLLTKALERAMQDARPREALAQWWRARLERIAQWLLDAEKERIFTNGPPAFRLLECAGEWRMPEGFVLKGRADRIERDSDGLVRIIDYKTGTVPSEKKVKAGTAPQLPLEAVMAENGAFGDNFKAEVKELLYVTLSGRVRAGNEKQILSKPDELRMVIAQAASFLPRLLKEYADPKMAFLASPHPGRVNQYDDYAGISRRAEWAEEDENVGD